MTFLAEIPDKKNEISTQNDTDEGEEDIVFDQTPVKVVCPHCGLNIITYIEHESSWLTYAVSIILLMTLGWAALCVVPIIFPLFKDVVHHCPRCLNILATRSRVAINGCKSEVMSMRFGSCVIVLARKWVFLLLGLALLIGGVHAFRSRHNLAATLADVPTRDTPLALSWQDFTKDCGYKSYLGNPIHVTVAFNEKYKAKTLKWKGKVHHIEAGFTFLWWSQRGAVFVSMDPPQLTRKKDVPDVLLLYEESEEKLIKAISKLKRGDLFEFEASMAAVGRRGAPHTMVLWEVLSAASTDV